MSNKEKRMIMILIGVLVIVILIIALVKGANKEQIEGGENRGEEIVVNEEKYLTELEDGTKINISEELNSTKTYKGLEISNIQFTQKDGKSVMLADVKNTGSSTHEAEIVKIEILGENGEVITDINPVIGKVEAGETIQLNATITGDVANAKDIKIVEK